MPFKMFEPTRHGQRIEGARPMLRLAKNGIISINRLAYRLLQEPTHVVLHVDLDAGLLGLQKVDANHPHCVKLTMKKTGGAEVAVKSLYRLVEDRFTAPISAEATFHGDKILAAPVLPKPPAIAEQNGHEPDLQEVSRGE